MKKTRIRFINYVFGRIWINRDVFIFGIHASAFVIRRAIAVLQSMKEGGWRGWRIIQNTSLRHFIYSKNAQANSNLNFGDIVGRGGRSAWVFVRTCWKLLVTYSLKSESYHWNYSRQSVLERTKSLIYLWKGYLQKKTTRALIKGQWVYNSWYGVSILSRSIFCDLFVHYLLFQNIRWLL